MKNIILSCLILLSISNLCFAQHSSWCGTEISQEWMEAFYQRNKDHLSHKAGNYPADTVPIVYHIVGDDNGNGYFGLNELFRSHCEIYDLYTDADIYFYIREINYINNTDAFENDQTNQLFDENDRTACNVYIVEQMNGVCGYSYVPENWTGFGYSGPNRGGIMLAKNCMDPGNTTYRHEMGHYLNLPHTFYGWEGQDAPVAGQNAPNTIGSFNIPVERADSSNCYASGDGFCDTPPDYISDRWACNFNRSYLDPQGIPFVVDERNFMSYSNDGCGTYFKEEQLAEVNNAPRNHRPYLLLDSVPPFDVFPNISDLSPSSNSLNMNNTPITLSWERIPNADYYQVQVAQFNFINPTFDEIITDTFFVITNPSPNATYEWRVKPISLTNICSSYSPISSFNISNLSAEIIVRNSSCNNNNDGRIQVIMNEAGSYTYYWSCSDPIINSSLQNINASFINQLAAEEYSLTVVRNNGDTLYSDIVVLAPGEIEIEITQVGNELIASVEGGTPPFTSIWNTGVQGYTLTNPSTGDYSFTILDQNGCQKTVSASFDQSLTSVSEIKESLGKLILAPNPIQSGDLTLTTNATESSSLLIQIRDISGKTILQESFETRIGSNSYSLNVQDLSNGMYIVNATMNGFTQSSKLIVNQ